MIDSVDKIDLHAVLVTLISVPIVIMVPGSGLVTVFLVGPFLVPQPLLWTRAFEHQRAGREMQASCSLTKSLFAPLLPLPLT